MASAQVVVTSVSISNSPSQDYTTNLDDHSNHNIDSPGFKPFTVILIVCILYGNFGSKQFIRFCMGIYQIFQNGRICAGMLK